MIDYLNDVDVGFNTFETYCESRGMGLQLSEDDELDTGYRRALRVWMPVIVNWDYAPAERIMKWVGRQILRAYFRQVSHLLQGIYHGAVPIYYNATHGIGVGVPTPWTGEINRTGDIGLTSVHIENGIKLGLDEYEFDDADEVVMEFDYVVVNDQDDEYLGYSGVVDSLPVFEYGVHQVDDLVRTGRVEAIVETPSRTFEAIGTSTPSGQLNFTIPQLLQYNGTDYPVIKIYDGDPENTLAYHYRLDHSHYFMLDDTQYTDAPGHPETLLLEHTLIRGGVTTTVLPFVRSLNDTITGDAFKNYVDGWGSSPYGENTGIALWSERYVPDPSVIYKQGNIDTIDGNTITLSGILAENTDVNRMILLRGDTYTIETVSSGAFILDREVNVSGVASVVDRKAVFIPGTWENNVTFDASLHNFQSSSPFPSADSMKNAMGGYWGTDQHANILEEAVYHGIVAIWDHLIHSVSISQIQGLNARGMFFEGGGFVGSLDGLQLT